MDEKIVEWLRRYIITIRHDRALNDIIYFHKNFDKNLDGIIHPDRESCPCKPFIFYVGDERSNEEIARDAARWLTSGEALI